MTTYNAIDIRADTDYEALYHRAGAEDGTPYDALDELEVGDRVLWGDRKQPLTVARIVTPNDRIGQSLTASVISASNEWLDDAGSDLRNGDVFLSPNGWGSLTGTAFVLFHGPRGGFYALERRNDKKGKRIAFYRAVRSYHQTSIGQPGQGAWKWEGWFDSDSVGASKLAVVEHGDAPEVLDEAGDLPAYERIKDHRVMSYSGDAEEHFVVADTVEELFDEGLAQAHNRAHREYDEMLAETTSVWDDVPSAERVAGTPDGYSHSTATVTHFVDTEHGLKAVIDAPAPWETPDGETPFNVAIKKTPWAENHRTFDSDLEAWTVDAEEIGRTSSVLQDFGYEVRDEAERPSDDEQDDEQDDETDEGTSADEERAGRPESDEGAEGGEQDSDDTDASQEAQDGEKQIATDGGVDTRGSYKYDYVELPPVAKGDVVRVTYVSGQTGTEKTREGDVTEVYANGFRFDHGGDDDLETAVRDHENPLSGGISRAVSTVKRSYNGEWGLASGLNRGSEGDRSTEATPVEVLVTERDDEDDEDAEVDDEDDVWISPIARLRRRGVDIHALAGLQQYHGSIGTLSAYSIPWSGSAREMMEDRAVGLFLAGHPHGVLAFSFAPSMVQPAKELQARALYCEITRLLNGRSITKRERNSLHRVRDALVEAVEGEAGQSDRVDDFDLTEPVTAEDPTLQRGRDAADPDADGYGLRVDELIEIDDTHPDDDDGGDGGRETPTRSEPADFGGGESTGVIDL